MNKKHKFGLFFYGKIPKSNKRVQIETQQTHGSYIKNGVKWIRT